MVWKKSFTWLKVYKYLKQALASQNPRSVFVNKGLLKHSHAHSFTYCLWLLSCYSRAEYCKEIFRTSKPHMLTIWPFTEKFCWPPNLIQFLLIHREDPHRKEITYYFLVIVLLKTSTLGSAFCPGCYQLPGREGWEGEGSAKTPSQMKNT